MSYISLSSSSSAVNEWLKFSYNFHVSVDTSSVFRLLQCVLLKTPIGDGGDVEWQLDFSLLKPQPSSVILFSLFSSKYFAIYHLKIRTSVSSNDCKQIVLLLTDKQKEFYYIKYVQRKIIIIKLSHEMPSLPLRVLLTNLSGRLPCSRKLMRSTPHAHSQFLYICSVYLLLLNTFLVRRNQFTTFPFGDVQHSYKNLFASFKTNT